MSEVQEQSQSIRDLAEALLVARVELEAAEKAAMEYAAAVEAGTKQAKIAEAAQIEANRAIARAAADAAAAALKAEADGSAAARRLAEAEKIAAREAAEAKSAAAKEAIEANRAIEAAERQRLQAVEEAAEKNAKLKELAVGALGGEETVEKYNKAKEALKMAGDASMGTGQRLIAGASAARFAAGTAGALAAGFAQFAAEARKASAELYLHEQRVRGLGPAYDGIRSATSGAADVQANFQLRQELLSRGFATTQAQATTLARAIREYAKERQVSQEQASAAIIAALDGDAQAAARFGVSIADASTSSERFAAITRQLADAQRGAAVATQDAAERARTQEEASGRAWATVKKFVYEVSGISMLDDAASGLVQAWDRLHSSTQAAATATTQLTTAQRTAFQVAENRKRLEELTAADAARALAAQQNAAALELQQLGERVTGLGRVVSAQEEYNAALTAANTIQRRAAETESEFNQRRLEATNNLIAAVRRKKEEQDHADDSARAQRELSMLAAQIRAHGGVVDARIRSLTPAQRYAEIQREIAEFAQRENESTTDSANRLTQLLQESEQMRQTMAQGANDARALTEAQRELADMLRDRDSLGAKLATVERQAGESALDRTRRLIEAQRELNALAQQGHEDAAAAFAQFREQTRERLALAAQKEEEERAAHNERARVWAEEQAAKDLSRQTQRADANEARFAAERADSLDQRLRESFGLAQEQSETVSQKMAEGAKTAASAIGELGTGAVNAMVAAATAGEDAGAAVAKYVDEWALAKAVQWSMQSAESFAGAGIAYLIRPDAVPGLLASGATYAALAAVAGITTLAIPNAQPARAGAGGVSGGGSTGLLGPATTRSESNMNAREPVQYTFNISGIMANEQTQEAIVGALRDASARGLIELGA